MPKQVLILCAANRSRSPLIAAYVNWFGNGHDITAISAGIKDEKTPYTGISLQLVAPFLEAGMNLSTHTPRVVTEDMMNGSELILTADQWVLDKLMGIHPKYANRSFTVKGYATGSDGDIVDAHWPKSYRENPPSWFNPEYVPGVMKGTSEAYRMMHDEIRDLARQLVEKLAGE